LKGVKMNLTLKAIINSIGSLVVFTAQWLISVLIVRINGYTEAGIFSLAMSISNVFSFIANYNIRNYQISDLNHEYSQTQYFFSRILTSLISFSTCVIYLAFASGYTQESKCAIFAYLVYSNINVISDIMLGALQLKSHLEINGYSNMIRGGTCFIAFMFPYCLKKDLLLSLWIMVIADLGITWFYDRTLYKKIEGSVGLLHKSDIYKIKNILKCCFPLMLSSIFPIITTAIPRRQIQLIYGEESLGYFSTIFTPTVLIITLAPALILAVVPVITDYWIQNAKKKFIKITLICYLGCVIITIIAELFALFWGKSILNIIFGESILQYYNLLYWAIAVTGFNAMTSCGNAILIPMRKNKSVAFASLLSMITAFSFSSIFIKKHYIYGAAYLLLTAYFIQIIAQTLIIIISIISKKEEKN